MTIRHCRILFALTSLGSMLLPLPAAAEDLVDIYQLALERDPQLKAAAAARAAVLESRPQAFAALLPQASGSANVARNRQDIDDRDPPTMEDTGGEVEREFFPDDTFYFNSKGYNLNITQPVYHHDLWIQLRQADSRIAQANAEYGAAEQALVLRVSDAYFNVLAAIDNVAFTRAEKSAIDRQLKQAKERFDVGLSAVTDVQEAQARYDLATAQELAAVNEVANAREALREITGSDHEDLLTLGELNVLQPPQPQDIDAWVDTALNQNLQLAAAAAAVEIARKEVDRIRAGHLPTVDALLTHDFDGIGNGSNFGDRDNADTIVSLQVTVPFYQGGAVVSRTRQAEALLRQNREELEQARRAAERQSRQAYLGILSTISTTQALKQAVASNTTALEAAEAGSEAGTRTLVDILDAQTNLYRAQRDYARARYDYVLNGLRLRQAAGTISPADLDAINQLLTAAPSSVTPAAPVPGATGSSQPQTSQPPVNNLP